MINRIVLAACVVASLPAALPADEGMWTFQAPPRKQLEKQYGFTPTQAWLDRVRLASVRLNDGGSGSFVSPNGLVLTNHHVVHGQLAKLSTKERNLADDGFYAATLADELPCRDLEINVLVAMVDVTARVKGAVEDGADATAAQKQREQEIARIEKSSTEETGLRSDVVSLYAGAEYWLYRYKKYTDVRLVFAPEKEAAFYGGDLDNFTYPRYCLDMSFVRVYENGKPASTPNYFPWKPAGAKEGELVFVSGNPGSTQRLLTLAQLTYQKQVAVPRRLAVYYAVEEALRKYAAKSDEHRRRATYLIDGFANARKAFEGMQGGLADPALIRKKAEAEAALKRAVADRGMEIAAAWDRIANAVETQKTRGDAHFLRNLRGARLAGQALTIVQYVAEVQKPNAERLPQFRDSALESLKHSLFAKTPSFPELEEAVVAAQLAVHAKRLGADDPLRRALIADRTPAEAAAAHYRGTKVGDPAFRKALIEGGADAVAASDDPLIRMARALDPVHRDLHTWHEANVESVFVADGATIAEARFAIHGKNTYPDANFTLRLSYGKVASYMLGTTKVPHETTYYGLFDRFYSTGGEPPFALSPKTLAARDRIDLKTPINFVCTCDIIGGNSGSPVINRDAELVGLIFDGNIQSLPSDYVFDDTVMRAVSVHTGGMVEGLSRIYGAHALVGELLRR